MKASLSTYTGPISTPYCLQLPSPLADGQCVTVKANAIEHESTRIGFNFGANPGYESDVLFHFDIRFDENRTIRNTKDTAWQKEENEGEMPVTQGEDFEISFAVTSTHYEVSVNGNKFCEYAHRMPMGNAKYFFVQGKVSIENITFSDGATVDSMGNLEIPYKAPITLYPGRKMYMSGIAPPDSNSWAIFLTAQESKDGPDTALCFGPRFQNWGQNDIIVINTKEKGNWQKEVRPESNPFKLERFCNVTIEVASDKYKVTVNDQHVFEFEHRIDFKRVTHFHIVGKINLNCVRL